MTRGGHRCFTNMHRISANSGEDYLSGLNFDHRRGWILSFPRAAWGVSRRNHRLSLKRCRSFDKEKRA